MCLERALGPRRVGPMTQTFYSTKAVASAFTATKRPTITSSRQHILIQYRGCQFYSQLREIGILPPLVLRVCSLPLFLVCFLVPASPLYRSSSPFSLQGPVVQDRPCRKLEYRPVGDCTSVLVFSTPLLLLPCLPVLHSFHGLHTPFVFLTCFMGGSLKPKDHFTKDHFQKPNQTI